MALKRYSGCPHEESTALFRLNVTMPVEALATEAGGADVNTCTDCVGGTVNAAGFELLAT